MSKSFSELVAEIERQRGARVDMRAPSQALRFDVSNGGDITATVTQGGARALAPVLNGKSGLVTVRGISEAAPAFSVDGTHEATWPLHQNALTQVMKWLDVPADYVADLRKSNPALLETTLNSLAQQKAGDERRMVRTLDGRMMALLGDGYLTMDNYDLMERAVLPHLAERDDLKIARCDMSDTRLYIQITTDKLRGAVRPGVHKFLSVDEAEREDLIQPMVTIRNSEFGVGSLAVEHGTLRLACWNGAIVAKVVRKNHVSAVRGGDGVLVEDVDLRDDTRRARDEALWLTLRDAIGAALSEDTFNKLLGQHRKAAEVEVVSAPDSLMDRLGKKFLLSDDQKAGVRDRLLFSRDMTQFGVAQAITAGAHGADADDAYALQVAGGAILTMDRAEWRSLDYIEAKK